MNIRSSLRRLRRAMRRHEPLITVSISKENLLHNLRTYREAYPEVRIAPVLKSNAYGHGLIVVAELLDRGDIAFFMVDSLYEAQVLRRAGIRTRVVVMGYVRPEAIAGSRLRDTEFAIVDIEQLRTLARCARAKTHLHLKLDTGMHRQGLLASELTEAVELIRSNHHLVVTGIATHLADADNSDTMFTESQLSVWDTGMALLSAAFPSIQYRHAIATKGAHWSATHGINVMRVGMGLYGYDMAPGEKVPLRPVLSMRSSIVSVREIPEGDAVGYNALYRAGRTSRIATVPAGYYEGIDRNLSNSGSLQVRGKACPIAGRVSMNMLSLDVTDLPEAARGDAVTLISANPDDPNSVRSMAALSGIPLYVLLAHIPAHLLRVVE